MTKAVNKYKLPALFSKEHQNPLLQLLNKFQMFAIIQSGGKQYRVAKDEKIIVENLNANVGDKIKLEVLFAQNDNGKAVFGNPNVEGAVVDAEVVKNFKDDKIIVFKKRRRQNSRRKNGHRQLKTQLKIINIKL